MDKGGETPVAESAAPIQGHKDVWGILGSPDVPLCLQSPIPGEQGAAIPQPRWNSPSFAKPSCATLSSSPPTKLCLLDFPPLSSSFFNNFPAFPRTFLILIRAGLALPCLFGVVSPALLSGDVHPAGPGITHGVRLEEGGRRGHILCFVCSCSFLTL